MKENSLIAKNPTAYHNYEILEKYEAGIVLSGTEIKSIVNNKVNLKDSYAIIRDGEVWSINIHISPYEFGNRFNLDPTRNRKLLLNRREINKLIGTIEQKGLTLVITCMYWKNNKVKVELGVARGKKLYDKREDMKRKDAKRDIERSMKNSI